MIDVTEFYQYLVGKGFDFFAGVPDSLLKDLCSCIDELCPQKQQVTAANEGNAVALAAGYHLSSGNYGVVYMQNSGLGNAVNPLLSLLDEAIYQIPVLFVVGWRGEPGAADEPQHVKQGKVTLPLLESIGLEYMVLADDYRPQIDHCSQLISTGKKPVVLVVRSGMFTPYAGAKRPERYTLTRETALDLITERLEEDDFIVSTTGKTSRELFELRERKGQRHSHDFLTVGAMGHTASLAFGMALGTDKNIYCIDGDGSFLMHMGSLGVIGSRRQENFRYILINNGVHDSVGGQPTAAFLLDLKKILSGCGFDQVLIVEHEAELVAALQRQRAVPLTALIVHTRSGARKDLGRPSGSLQEYKRQFTEAIRG